MALKTYMPLEVKKQNRESSQALVRRFARSVQQSGILLRARELRFKHREKSNDMKKVAALRREEKKKEFARLKKLGLLKKNAKR